uniref:U6 snRNA-associated Sm-like protein LSm2 n=1 Tax=Globodera rostochiensis TaxID=31243 RepID=A0A914HZP0_GLORO
MPKPSIFALIILFFVSFGIPSSLGRAIEPQNEVTVHGYIANKAYVEGHNIPFPADLVDVCPRNWKYLKAWINPMLADRIINRQACLLHMLSLHYDPATKVFSNQPNVNVTFLGDKPFGSVWPTACLLSSENTGWNFACRASTELNQDEAQFMPMVQHFEEKHGYERDVTLLAAPYDWRRTANMVEMDPYFANLTNLIEKSVNASGQKAFLVCHSMGNLIINYFLNRKVGKEWQQKYLNGTINVSAPWAGSLMLVEQILSGNADRLQFGGSLILPDSIVRNFIRTMPSSFAMLPSTLAFPPNQTLLTLAGVDYSTKNMDAFLALAGSAYMAPLYHELTATVDAQKYTPMFCVHSKTADGMPIFYNYTNGIAKRPKAKMGDGDALVNIESLRVCQKWMDEGKLVKKVVEIDGPTHMAILHEDKFYKAEIICGKGKNAKIKVAGRRQEIFADSYSARREDIFYSEPSQSQNISILRMSGAPRKSSDKIQIFNLCSSNFAVFDGVDRLLHEFRLLCHSIHRPKDEVGIDLPNLSVVLLPEQAQVLLENGFAQLKRFRNAGKGSADVIFTQKDNGEAAIKPSYRADNERIQSMARQIVIGRKIKAQKRKALSIDGLLSAKALKVRKLDRLQFAMEHTTEADQNENGCADDAGRVEECTPDELAEAMDELRQRELGKRQQKSEVVPSCSAQIYSDFLPQFPQNAVYGVRLAVFRDLWRKGFYLADGAKFGCDYLAYRKPPPEQHSEFMSDRRVQGEHSGQKANFVGHGQCGFASALLFGDELVERRRRSMMLFFSFFKSMVGREVIVELKNDLSICGTLHSVDQYLNMKVNDISVTDVDRHPHMISVKNCFIRGSVIRYVHLPTDGIDTALLQEASRKEILQSRQQQQQQQQQAK